MQGLTIIVCTHNNAELLKECLLYFEKQIFNQNYHYEFIIVDNCSEDHTINIVNDFIKRETIPNLKYVFEPNIGLGNARLTGVKNSQYEWIGFIDDDVRIQPDWVSSAISFIDSHPHAGVISGKIELHYLETPSSAALKCEAGLCKVDYGNEELKFQPDGQPIRFAGAAIIFQKKALEETGWLEKQFLIGRRGKSLSSGEDTEMILRIKNKKWEIWYSPSLCAKHIIPPTRMTVKYLCLLYRGLALTSVQLRTIALDRPIPTILKLNWLFTDILFTTRRICGWIFHDLIKNQTLGDKRLIQIYEGIGRVESSINQILKPINFNNFSE